ncbi:hypothetical protein GW891_02775 [bacterium]|nr:hypothetical protein [bacterium]
MLDKFGKVRISNFHFIASSKKVLGIEISSITNHTKSFHGSIFSKSIKSISSGEFIKIFLL